MVVDKSVDNTTQSCEAEQGGDSMIRIILRRHASVLAENRRLADRAEVFERGYWLMAARVRQLEAKPPATSKEAS